MNALRGPIIDQQHIKSPALHVSLPEGRPQQDFRGALLAGHGGPSTARRQILTCQNDDITPDHLVGHIPRDQYTNLHFYSDEIRFIRIMSWFWGTYGALHQLDLVESFCHDPRAFLRVVQHQSTALALQYVKVREVEVHKLVYTIPKDVANALNKKFVVDVVLPFDDLTLYQSNPWNNF